jgi:hypothetical protein
MRRILFGMAFWTAVAIVFVIHSVVRAFRGPGATVLLVVMLGGCVSMMPRSAFIAHPLPDVSDEPPARAAEAIDVVWHLSFGRTDAPPTVQWLREPHLNCRGATSGDPGFFYNNECLGGLTLSGYKVIVVIRQGQPIHLAGLAHEFQHARLERDGAADTGVGHQQWFYAAFAPANALLAERGM